MAAIPNSSGGTVTGSGARVYINNTEIQGTWMRDTWIGDVRETLRPTSEPLAQRRKYTSGLSRSEKLQKLILDTGNCTDFHCDFCPLAIITDSGSNPGSGCTMKHNRVEMAKKLLSKEMNERCEICKQLYSDGCMC